MINIDLHFHIPPSGKPWTNLSDKERESLKNGQTTFLCGAHWGIMDPEKNAHFDSDSCYDPSFQFVVNCDVCILMAFSKGIKI